MVLLLLVDKYLTKILKNLKICFSIIFVYDEQQNMERYKILNIYDHQNLKVIFNILILFVGYIR